MILHICYSLARHITETNKRPLSKNMDKSHQSCPAKAKDFCDFKVYAVFISNISELCRVKLAYLVRILADLPVG